MAKQVKMRVGQDGRIVIPFAFRKALDFKVGDEVLLLLQDDELLVTTRQRRIEHARERARRYLKEGRSLVNELLAERRAAAEQK
jgi:AbrB family looped-hinge helix DNA binding protein